MNLLQDEARDILHKEDTKLSNYIFLKITSISDLPTRYNNGGFSQSGIQSIILSIKVDYLASL